MLHQRSYTQPKFLSKHLSFRDCLGIDSPERLYFTQANPQLAWLASLLATSATTVSGSLTVTANITKNWEINIPVQMTWISGVSADGVINAFPSSDGGTHFDVNPAFSISIARGTTSSSTRQTSIRLPTGQWALQILNSGPSTGSASVVTAQIITSIQNQ